MSTAEAIRIGTATTGRLITGAALVLAVVAGAFVFSDLVMMKYLAFGLLIALLLDATIIRMFLVPAIMKRLGDDCWWAPRWLKRVQEKLGLGETELPDERKRPAVREPEEALVGAGAPVPPPNRPRPPHDPGHPDGPRAIAPGRPPAPPRANPPSAASTTRIPTAPAAPVGEAPTTRFSAPKGAGAPPRAAGKPPASGRGSSAAAGREIESWLGDLRASGAGAATPSPSNEPPTRAIPEQRPRAQKPPQNAPPGNEPPTTAIPAQKPEADATEKIDTRDDERKRRGGGVSAADLLRREGRL
jgi:RND superfamily putative drug exporter